MKQLLVLLCSVIFINVFAQKPASSQSKIDQKYGLNKFKLGATYSSFPDLTLILTATQGKMCEYDYNGSDLKTFMNYNVSKVLLQFYDNQLYSVIIRIGVNKSDDHQTMEHELLRKIDLGYGNHVYALGEETMFIGKYKYKRSDQYSWNGKKCVLFLDSYMLDLNSILKEKEEVVYNKYIEVWIKSKLIDKKIATDDL